MKEMKFETKVIHVGGEPDPITGAIMPPIYQTSTYVQSSPGEHKGYEYTRSHNPTRTRLEECLASLENAKHCLVTASGLSASSLIMHMLPKGSKIICGDDVYGGTYRLFSKVFPDIHEPPPERAGRHTEGGRRVGRRQFLVEHEHGYAAVGFIH